MNESKLRQAFSETLNISPDRINDELEYNTIKQWDSIAHMALIAAIEQTFDILMETDDIINMSSYAKAKEIVGKYVVALS